MRRATIALLASFILADCTPRDATLRLKHDTQADTIEIIHARFPCHSPDLHLFGYRFRLQVNKEYGYGVVCWDFSSSAWAWQILPEYSLSRLNIGSKGKRHSLQ
jgi:hypothetical protein